MRIFRIVLLLGVILAAPLAAGAQHKGKDRAAMHKEVMEFKMKFLAQEMDLKEDQQKRFFDLYENMEEEKRALFRQIRIQERKLRDDKEATDADYAKVSEAIAAAKAKDAEIDRRYDEQFSKFLSQKQIYKMKEAERKFGEKMRQMYKGKHRHGGAPKKR